MGGGPAFLLILTRHYFTVSAAWFGTVAAFWCYVGAKAVFNQRK
jgi:hypothetical protein